jgi:hypothetical protein
MFFLKRFNHRLLNLLVLAFLILFFSHNGFCADIFKDTDNYCEKYCGLWTYFNKGEGGQKYFQITRDKQGKYKFRDGGSDYGHKKKIIWYGDNIMIEDLKGNPLGGIYLKPSNGKLKGIFFSHNFWATHGIIQSIEINIDKKSKCKVIYSERSVIGKKTNNLNPEPALVYEATLIDADNY